jgi:SAM-dependent methyltransferase
MPSDSPFDSIAQDYDLSFSLSVIGSMQRDRIWQFLEKELPIGSSLNVMEINCGTGVDAHWFSKKGHRVIATDLSPEMIRIAEAKDINNVEFEVCSFTELQANFRGQKFDLVFSNFAGLNCIDETELRSVQQQIHNLLRPNGKFVGVFLGKYCWVERLYFRWKGARDQMNRRLNVSEARLDENTVQITWCYSSNELIQIFDGFSVLKIRPVGLFLPPSYFESKAKQSPFLFRLLNWMERSFVVTPLFANRADHLYMSFVKK